MKDHAFIKMLKSFSPLEIREFGEFIKVPYFNKRKAVEKLYKEIKRHYPVFEEKNFVLNEIFNKVFPGKQFNESTVRVLLHYLHELSKKFLAFKNFENNQLEYDFILQSEMFKRKQVYDIDKAIDKSLSELDLKKYVSEIYYYQKFRLEYERLYYLSEIHSGVFEKLLDRFDFRNILSDFTTYYLLKTIRTYINILNIEIIYKKNFNKEPFEKIISRIDIKDFDDNPVFRLYYYLLRILVSRNNEKHYFKAKELLNEIGNQLSTTDLSEIIINLKNYCKRKSADGNDYYLREEFELIKKEIELCTYKVHGHISPLFYRNSVNTALRLNKTGWLKNFLVEFRNELPEQQGNDVFFYCSALYEFHLKNYENALKLISKIKYDEVYQKVESKILQMMIYFEINAVESLFSSLEAFRQYLSNNKLIPDNRKIPYNNFYKMMSKLLLLKNKKNKYGLINLKKNLLAEYRLSNKIWLIEKTDELLNLLNSQKDLKIA